MSLLGLCGEGLPPLRTWELAETDPGSQEIGFTFDAPHRKPSEGYWDYKLGLVLPAGVEFDLSGQAKIYSASGQETDSFRFDSARRSSWLQDEYQVSHLLPGKLGIKDGEQWRVVITFDRPLERKTAVVLHFLSHQNTAPQLIE